MMSSPDSSLILYACIAKGTIILAEFNSRDADLGAQAMNCLEKTPQFHSVFSHAVRNKTYMFIADHPFVYFGIFDGNLEKSSCFSFLKTVQSNSRSKSPQAFDYFERSLFPRGFNPMFHQLLASPLNSEVLNNDGGNLGSVREKNIGLIPLLGGSAKKKRVFVELPKESKVDVSSDDGITLSREFSLVSSHSKNGLFAVDKAKLVWKKQIWLDGLVIGLDCVLYLVWDLVVDLQGF